MTASAATMADKMATCLWFPGGEARAAAEFYAGLFPDSCIDSPFAAPSDYPGGRSGGEVMVAFTLCGRPFVALNGADVAPSQAVSFQVFTDDQAETDRYWDAIVGGGGTESRCGWCRDRWGFSWQIVPRALTRAMSDPEAAARERAFKAMMTMGRLNIAAIEAARAGTTTDSRDP